MASQETQGERRAVATGGAAGLSFEGTRSTSLAPRVVLDVGLGLCRRGYTARLSTWERKAGAPLEIRWIITGRTTYLTLPLRVRLALGRGRLHPYLRAGFEAARLLAAEEVHRSAAADGSRAFTGRIDTRGSTSPLDLGLTCGAGLQLPALEHFWRFDGEYFHGLSNRNASANRGCLRSKTRAWRFGLGLCL